MFSLDKFVISSISDVVVKVKPENWFVENYSAITVLFEKSSYLSSLNHNFFKWSRVNFTVTGNLVKLIYMRVRTGVPEIQVYSFQINVKA